MTDVMTPSTHPDYELTAALQLTAPEQFKALGDPLRQKVLGLLSERAATTGQLADALACPTSTMAHHLNVLLNAGLIRVVRTRQVRAITERYFGRTARSFVSVSGDTEPFDALRQAMAEIASSPLPAADDVLPLYAHSHARIPATQARAFADRILQLAHEFSDMMVPGEQMYGFVAAVYPTDWPELPCSES